MEFEAGLQWMIREDYGTDWASEAHEKARDRQHRGEPTWCGKRLRVKAGKTVDLKKERGCESEAQAV